VAVARVPRRLARRLRRRAGAAVACTGCPLAEPSSGRRQDPARRLAHRVGAGRSEGAAGGRAAGKRPEERSRGVKRHAPLFARGAIPPASTAGAVVAGPGRRPERGLPRGAADGRRKPRAAGGSAPWRAGRRPRATEAARLCRAGCGGRRGLTREPCASYQPDRRGLLPWPGAPPAEPGAPVRTAGGSTPCKADRTLHQCHPRARSP